MTVSRDILVSLLKLTQTGSVRSDSVQRDTRVPMQVLSQNLLELSEADLIKEDAGAIELTPNQRIRIAFLALRTGADFRRVCTTLSWSEFERIAADTFELNDYEVIKNFHFKHGSRRWEMDIVAFEKPLIICADCKHWRHGWRRAATVKAAQAQTDRTEAFTEALPNYKRKIKLENWQTAKVMPMILSLEAGPAKFFDGVPIVPVLQLQDFINELPANDHLLKSFCQKDLSQREDLQRFVK